MAKDRKTKPSDTSVKKQASRPIETVKKIGGIVEEKRGMTLHPIERPKVATNKPKSKK